MQFLCHSLFSNLHSPKSFLTLGNEEWELNSFHKTLRKKLLFIIKNFVEIVIGWLARKILGNGEWGMPLKIMGNEKLIAPGHFCDWKPNRTLKQRTGEVMSHNYEFQNPKISCWLTRSIFSGDWRLETTKSHWSGSGD